MSAVAGVLTLDGSQAPVQLFKSITAHGMHRGADAVTVKLLGTAALGCALLRITDEDYNEEQPVGLVNEGIWAVLDGRIDNRDELLAMLSIPSFSRGISDCHLALLTYQRWGRRCVGKLVGSFALVLWDARARYVFCAVDHLGGRPLFYARQPHRVVVASSIRQVLRDGDIPRDIDDTYMLSTLCFPSSGPLWSRRTPYQAVRRLLPGRTLTLYSNGRDELERYWHPEELPVLYSRSRTDHAEELCATFTEVVRAHLRSREGVMTTFSGGLDSSSITCTAAMLASSGPIPCKRVQPYSLTFDEGTESDEREYRQPAIEQYALEVIEVRGDNIWHLQDLQDGSPQPDEPFGAYVARNELRADAEAAQRAGCNATLFGIGGDELMAGMDLFPADYLHRGHLRKLALAIQERSRLPNMTQYDTRFRVATPRRLSIDARDPLASASSRRTTEALGLARRDVPPHGSSLALRREL